MNRCNKLKSSNPYVVATWWNKSFIFFTKNIWSNRTHTLKYLRSTTLGGKHIGNRKSEFVAKTQFLMNFSEQNMLIFTFCPCIQEAPPPLQNKTIVWNYTRVLKESWIKNVFKFYIKLFPVKKSYFVLPVLKRIMNIKYYKFSLKHFSSLNNIYCNQGNK